MENYIPKLKKIENRSACSQLSTATTCKLSIENHQKKSHFEITKDMLSYKKMTKVWIEYGILKSPKKIRFCNFLYNHNKKNFTL
jgi:hypothetical protein